MTGRTRRARIARSLGPEVVAGLASVVMLGLVALLVLRPAGTVAPSPGPTSRASTGPSGIPSSTPIVESPTASLSAGVTASTWAAQATVLLGAEERLASIRERLVAALATVPRSTTDVARELRTMNTTLTGALDAIAAMESSGAPSGLVDDLQAAHEAALAVSLETLQASVQNAPAYQAGGEEVVAVLEEVALLAQRVRAESGLPSAAP